MPHRTTTTTRAGPLDPRYYLHDWRRLVTGEPHPALGPPVRLSGLVGQDGALLIEFCWHDDDFTSGAYVFWLWVLLLAEPAVPAPGHTRRRRVIEYGGAHWNGLPTASS